MSHLAGRLYPAILLLLVACATGGHRMTDEIDILMRRYDGVVPGASLLVVKDGKPVVRRSWGMANIEACVMVTPATNFRLASVTKQFTAAAVLLLREDGRLELDDRVTRWLPSLRASTGSVTIRQLLTHTSGIADYEDLIPAGTRRQVRDTDVLSLLEEQDSLYFPPGAAYKYSNSGYALLALVIEKASGRGFAAFLHERVFLPLGMTETVAYEDGVSSVSSRAFGHTLSVAAWTRRDQSTTSAVLGDGGIYSSIDDLAKWDAAWYDSRLLSDASRRLAVSPHVQTDEAGVTYGFGWRITGETSWHSGETSGFRNVIVRFPSQRLTVVLLTNRDDPEPYETALAVADLYRAGSRSTPTSAR